MLPSSFPGYGLLALVVLALLAASLLAAKRARLALVLILGAGLLLRLQACSDPYLHPWDESYHAVVAKNMGAHPWKPTLYQTPVLNYAASQRPMQEDLPEWTRTHVWLHKPPLTLWLLAGSLKLLGTHELALRLPSVLLSTAALYLTFLLGRSFFGTQTGLLAAALHATHGYLILLVSGRQPTDHVDTVFFFLVELGIAFALLRYPGQRAMARPPERQDATPAAYWKGSLILGVLVGLAVLTKWLTGLIVLLVWATTQASREPLKRWLPHGALVLTAAALLALPWQLFTRAAFPAEVALESAYNFKHITVPLEGHRGPIWYYVRLLPEFFGKLAFLPLAWLAITAFRRRSAELGALLVWFGVPLAAFSLCATKMPAYILVAAPVLFLAQAALCADLFRWLTGKAELKPGAASDTSPLPSPGLAQNAPQVRLAMKPLSAQALSALLLVAPLATNLRTLRPWAPTESRPDWASELQALAPGVAGSRAALFNVRYPIEAMFYTPYSAYGFLPTPQQLQEVISSGYTPVVFTPGSLPRYVTENPGVRVLRSPALGLPYPAPRSVPDPQHSSPVRKPERHTPAHLAPPAQASTAGS